MKNDWTIGMTTMEQKLSDADSILSDIQDGVVTFTDEGVLASANRGAERLFGVPEGELYGRPVQALFVEDVDSEFPLALEALLRLGNRPQGATMYGVRANGSRVAVDVRFTRTEHSGVSGYAGLVRDVTERKRAEDALQESRDRIQRHNLALAQLAMARRTAEMEARFADLIDEIARVACTTLALSRVTIWELDDDETFMKNSHAYGASGEPAPREKAMFKLEHLPQVNASSAQLRIFATASAMYDPRVRGIRDAYLTRHGTRALIVCQLSFGDRVWGVLFFEHSGSPREWVPEELQFGGSVADFLIMAYEDDKRRKAELEVRQLNEALEMRVAERTADLQRTNDELKQTLETLERAKKDLVTAEKMAALGDMVAGVAHEINTPVGIAVTAASHLEQKTRAALQLYESGAIKRGDFEAYLKIAGESARMLLANLTRASDLVQSFKNVAVDQSSEARRTFKLRAYIDEVLLSLRPRLKKTPHTVEVECDDAIALNSYPGAYSQIVTNFVINSLLHGFAEEHPGGVMRIIARVEGEHLVLRYTDNGKGIAPENLKRIFDPFFTTRRGTGGSGLGLNLVYNIVTSQLGGSISCESEPGKGVVFTLQLPMKLGEQL